MHLTRMQDNVTGKVINRTIPSSKDKSWKNNNLYTEFKYLQRSLTSFIIGSITVYTSYYLMSQIKVKKLTSLLLSTNTSNTLCSSAWGRNPAIFFHLLFAGSLGVFIILASVLPMPPLTLKTSGPLFKIPGLRWYQLMLIIRGSSIKYL